jgi:TM2 domain-containing membrane protein YozV
MRRHEPPGTLIFRAIFFVSNLPFQCFEILISSLRKGSHKFLRQFRKYATYGAGILTLSTNLAGLGTIAIAQTYIVVLFAIRDPVEASPNLVGIGANKLRLMP